MCISDILKTVLPQKKKKRTKSVVTNFERFLQKNVPIIMVMGPHNCGKTTIADMLRACSQFTVIKLGELLQSEAIRRTTIGDQIATYLNRKVPVPDNLVVKILKEEIVSSYVTTKGFIIDGFPANITQAVYFKHKICKPSCIVYVYLSLDALFARMLARNGEADLDELRINYIREVRKTDDVYNKFDDFTLKMFNSYPPEQTCNKIIEHLEDNYGFKFIRIGI